MEIGTNVVKNDVNYYNDFLVLIQNYFGSCVSDNPPLFTTNVLGFELFQIFLDNLPKEHWQHHNCNTCKGFVQKYGNLVTYEDGCKIPIMWGPTIGIYKKSFKKINELVQNAKITGVFLTDLPMWGSPATISNKSPTGEFKHMSVTPPYSLLFKDVTKTPEQAIAEKKQDFIILQQSIRDFSIDAIKQATRILSADDVLYRSEKCLGVAKWFHEVCKTYHQAKNHDIRHCEMWKFVATAPPGFCHIRSSMIGTLLEDITDGLPFKAIRKRFAEKMHPLQYQRPQNPPKKGNIDQAEKIVTLLESEKSLERRFARLEEIQTIWIPQKSIKASDRNSIFGHLKTKDVKTTPIELPIVKITWRKFAKEILPTAESIDFFVPYQSKSYLALVTAVHPDAPPILQWDTEKYRNPVSWYVYSEGSTPQRWNLSARMYVKVNAIAELPCMWNEPEKYKHHGEGVVLILNNCRDTSGGVSLALFPENLKAEYRSIRTTIEAYSKSKKLIGSEEATACGLDLRKGGILHVELKVTTATGKANYIIDRWD